MIVSPSSTTSQKLVQKAEALLKLIEQDTSLESFHLDQQNFDALIQILKRQDETIPAFLSLLNHKDFPQNQKIAFLERITAVANLRSRNATKLQVLTIQQNSELLNLRSTIRKLLGWKKSWIQPNTKQSSSTIFA
ncbi:MAG: hypothetical protein NZL93_04140 [Chthoniobacterales bacterium]|nr:hypothetical protein [Chthoniobacterales bacterium]